MTDPPLGQREVVESLAAHTMDDLPRSLLIDMEASSLGVMEDQFG